MISGFAAMAVVGVILLAVPVVTGIVEQRDEEIRDILRMADRDRRRKRTTQPQRRMRYAAIGGKIKPRRSCSSNRGHKRLYKVSIAQERTGVKWA